MNLSTRRNKYLKDKVTIIYYIINYYGTKIMQSIEDIVIYLILSLKRGVIENQRLRKKMYHNF